jgi:hypothetical protein
MDSLFLPLLTFASFAFTHDSLPSVHCLFCCRYIYTVIYRLTLQKAINRLITGYVV